MNDNRRPISSRFAPSPTGYLHLGHLVNAIYVWGLTRALGGQVLLRLEDHDRGRCRLEYEAAILEDLEWLKLEPDHGTPAEFRAGSTPYRQSDQGERYADILAGLVDRNLVYTCTCSRKDILARTGDQHDELRYDGHCRSRGYHPEVEGGTRLLLDGRSYGFHDLCLGPQVQRPAAQCGDLLLKDRHGCWTYQFAVTVDDWLHGVNLIIRGEDLLDSTGRQLQLAQLLGCDGSPRFLHHPLIHDSEGKKLSKRDFSRSLRDYRAAGWSPGRLLGAAASAVGLVEERQVLDPETLSELFLGGNLVQQYGRMISDETRQEGST